MDLSIYSESSLSKKIKKAEEKTESYINQDSVLFVRCDGQRFSKFTKGFDKPFDTVFREAMKKTMISLCNEIQGAVMGYTQSDEITIMFKKQSKESEIMFSGRVQKIVSDVASSATLYFNHYFILESKESENVKFYETKYMKATFDCRLFEYDDNPKEVFIWRILDCNKNAIQMIARNYFSHKEIDNKSLYDMKQMLMEKGILINNYDNNFLYGVIAIKETMLLNEGTDRECVRNKFVVKEALEGLEEII